MKEVTEEEGGCVLALRVIPRARRNEVVDILADGRIKIRLTAPPLDGRANQALIVLLAKVLKVRKDDISIRSGEKGRDKMIAVRGPSENNARKRLRAAIKGSAS